MTVKASIPDLCYLTFCHLNGSDTSNNEPIDFDSFSGTGSGGLRIIGFKNVTAHAGATTLIYMLKKHLEVAYNVVAMEVDTDDFRYFKINFP